MQFLHPDCRGVPWLPRCHPPVGLVSLSWTWFLSFSVLRSFQIAPPIRIKRIKTQGLRRWYLTSLQLTCMERKTTHTFSTGIRCNDKVNGISLPVCLPSHQVQSQTGWNLNLSFQQPQALSARMGSALSFWTVTILCRAENSSSAWKRTTRWTMASKALHEIPTHLHWIV